MEKTYDVISICNALVDIVFEANDTELASHKFNKGEMHLVDNKTRETLLEQFLSRQKAIELGGSCLNAIRALALLNKKTGFTGMVSEDDFGKQIQERLAKLNISGNLHVTNQEATGTCMVLVTPDGERTMATYLGASRLYDQSHIPSQHLQQAKVFHFSGYQWDTEQQKEGIHAAIRLAKESDTLISFDIADPFVVRAHREDFVKMVSDSHIVFSNKEEAKILYGLSPEETGKKIASNGAIAVIKLGAEGALICHGDEVTKIEPVQTNVVDTTAAGDMFAAGFLYGYTSRKPLSECGKIAATLASDVISRFGATLSETALEKVRHW